MSDMPWLKSYPPKVHWDVRIEPKPVQHILAHAASNWPDRPAIEFMGKRLSYRELDDLSSRVAEACNGSASSRGCMSACSCRTRRTA